MSMQMYLYLVFTMGTICTPIVSHGCVESFLLFIFIFLFNCTVYLNIKGDNN